MMLASSLSFRWLLLGLVPCLSVGPLAAQAGTVRWEAKISKTAGGFVGPIDSSDHFGGAIASIGDFDGDGIGDLAVGADGDDDGGHDQGAVWILLLKGDGTVKSERKISGTSGGFTGALAADDHFGSAVASLGDLDGNGVTDLAVGAEWDDDGANLSGSLWILFLNADGTVAGHRKISNGNGGFGSGLDANDNFGRSVAALGDVDGDGVVDLAVGAPGDGPPNQSIGAVWILFLQPDGRVKARQKINELNGGFGGNLGSADLFGLSVAGLGDLDSDGTPDLLVGAPRGDDEGAVWVLFLNLNGRVRHEQRISRNSGGFGGFLGFNAQFGISVAAVGDLDGDGLTELAVGANHDSTAGNDTGATWIVFPRVDGTVKDQLRITEGQGGFGGDLQAGLPNQVGDQFGWSLAALGDQDGDGARDLAVGSLWDRDGGGFPGAVWLLFLMDDRECWTIDFETEDDFTTPLVNGQHIDTEFGVLATLSSTGLNAGLSIFDSTAGGPNDPSQDRDLLVGSGNLLILQTENLPPDANDVFPRPNDDSDGGTMTFAFTGPMEPRSLALIDIDATDGGARVILRDSADRQRIYTVPADWTGDLLLGQPARGVLDVTTLAPQPGFASVATALEDPGFDRIGVVRLDVVLDGSGAIDDLELCRLQIHVQGPHAPWRARGAFDGRMPH